MRLARAALPDQRHRLGPRDVTSFGQFADFRRRNLRRPSELELFQRFHPWQLGIVQPVRNRVPVAFLTLHGQQRFQVADVAVVLFHRLLG